MAGAIDNIRGARCNPTICVHKETGVSCFVYDGYFYFQTKDPYFYNPCLQVYWDPRDMYFYTEEQLYESGKLPA